MLNKDSCKKIGLLLKKANSLQLYYYKANKRMSAKDVPSELIGFKCLRMVMNRPSEGIKFLKQRADPFYRFCKAQGQKKTDITEKGNVAYAKIAMFKKLLQEVTDEVDEIKTNCSLTVAERNLINLEYFS